MHQTKLESLLETCVNTAVGFFVSFVAWPLIAWKCDIAYDTGQHWEMVFWFTILSVARGYAVRRWFNSYFKRFVAWVGKNMQVIILNGPRDTGKDTAADHLVEKHGFTKLEMKGSLRRLAHAMASLTCADPVAFCDSLEFNRVRKDTVIAPELGNRTWPEFLIWLSEAVCKPIFGQSVFAMAAVKSVRDSGADKIVFSDGGFEVEVDTLFDELKCDMRIIHMYREGRSFSSVRKDSRGYVQHPTGAPCYPLHNDAGVVQLKLELDYFIGRLS